MAQEGGETGTAAADVQPEFAHIDQDGLVVTPPLVWGNQRAHRLGNELTSAVMGCLGVPVFTIAFASVGVAVGQADWGGFVVFLLCVAAVFAAGWVWQRLGVRQQLFVTPLQVVFRRGFLLPGREVTLATRGLAVHSRLWEDERGMLHREVHLDGQEGSVVLTLPPVFPYDPGPQSGEERAEVGVRLVVPSFDTARQEVDWIVRHVEAAVAIAEAVPAGGEAEMRAALEGVRRDAGTDREHQSS